MGIKCPNCGANNSNDLITCEYCGTALGVTRNSKLNSSSTSKKEITKKLSNSIDSASLEYRDKGKMALFLIVTCGFYYFVLLGDWLNTIKKNKSNDGLKSVDPSLAIFLTIVTCTAASIYFNYKVARDAASIARKSGGNNSPIRNGINPPLENLPEIILWGGIISFFIGLISGGTLIFIDVIFAIWSTIALQKSVEFMAGVKPNT